MQRVAECLEHPRDGGPHLNVWALGQALDHSVALILVADRQAYPGLLESAVRLAAAAHAAWQRPGTLDSREFRDAREQRAATLRALLPPPAFEAAWTAGAALSAAAAIESARDILARLSFSPPASPRTNDTMAARAHAGSSLLSPREREVASLVSEGLTNKEIAGRLTITERTAENHVQHVMDKLGFRTRSQIAAWATRAAPPDAALAKSRVGV